MSQTPLPAKLVLLNDLGHVEPGTKVRFLGWYVLSSPRYDSLSR